MRIKQRGMVLDKLSDIHPSPSFKDGRIAVETITVEKEPPEPPISFMRNI